MREKAESLKGSFQNQAAQGITCMSGVSMHWPAEPRWSYNWMRRMEEIRDTGDSVGEICLVKWGFRVNRAGEKCVGNREKLRVVQGEQTEGNEDLGWWGNRTSGGWGGNVARSKAEKTFKWKKCHCFIRKAARSISSLNFHCAALNCLLLLATYQQLDTWMQSPVLSQPVCTTSCLRSCCI